MTSLLFEVGPGLAFRFEGVAEGLADRAASFLSYFAVEALTPESAARRPLVVSSQPPPTTGPGAASVRLVEEGLEVREASGVTVFESDGAVGWCQPAQRRGGLQVKTGAPEALDRFVGLALAPLLIELADAEGWLGVHAAAVAIEGRGVLLPGPSGAGKSTIFLGSHQAGQDLLSDDLVWLREDPDREGRVRIYPFPRRQPWREGVPSPTVASAPLAAVVCPVIVDAKNSCLEPIGAGETLETLLEQSGLLGSDEATRGRFRSLARLAGSAPGYRLLAGSDRQAVAGLLAGLVRVSTG